MPEEEKIYWCYICRIAVKIEGGRWKRFGDDVASDMVKGWIKQRRAVILAKCPRCD